MNQLQFVKNIHSEVINNNLLIYRRLFFETSLDKSPTDPYWKEASKFYASLSKDQKDVLFRIIRQVMVDTTSNIFGVLDGVTGQQGECEGLTLTTEDGSEKLNDGLQDLFLKLEENTDVRQW